MFSDSPREVSVKEAKEIFRAAGPYMGRICVSHTDSVQDLALMFTLQPTAIQISHPHTLPVHRPYQVIRVIQPGDPVPESADAVIVDSSMGKGTPYDHEYAKKIISMSEIPVILAGGLNPENIREAVGLRPYAVDVASGVESSPGIKDTKKVMRFVKNAREACNAA